MLRNFEQQTDELNEYETEQLLPVMIAGLRTKKGKAAAVTNRTIVTRLNAIGYKLNDARCRKIINHIRCHDLIPGLIATSDGYFIAQNSSELIDYEESLLGRENAIKAVRLAIHRQRQILFGDVKPANPF